MSHGKVTSFFIIFTSLILNFSCSQKSIEKISYGEWASHYNSALGKFAKTKLAAGMQRVIKETYTNENSKKIKCKVVVTEKETILGMRGNLVQTLRERTFEQTPKEPCQGIKPSDAPYNNEGPEYSEKRLYSTKLGFLGIMRPYQKPNIFREGSISRKDSYFKKPEGLVLESKFFFKEKLLMHRKEELLTSPQWEIKNFLKSYNENQLIEVQKSWHETYQFISKQEILKLITKPVKNVRYMMDRYTAY